MRQYPELCETHEEDHTARGQPNAMLLNISSNMAVHIFTRMMSST